MKCINKKILYLFSILLISNSANASLLWDINHGIDLYRKNNFISAKEYFISYLNNNPNDKDGYFWLAKTYSKLEKNDYKKIQENYKKAYELTFREKNIEKVDFNIKNNDDIEDYFDMAAMYFEVGDIDEALVYADMMLKINPKSSSAYFIKAKVAQMKNQIKKAKEYLNLALIYNNELLKTNLAKSLNISNIPDLTKEMYNSFATEAYFSGDITSAIKYLKKYVELDSSNSDILLMLIDAYIKNNELYEAQTIINKILENNPNNIQAILYQAKIYEINKNGDKENYLLKAYAINPNNQQVLLELGNHYLSLKDYINAYKYFEVLINVNDELYEAYFGYIYSSLELGKIDQVVHLIRKAISINPQASETYFLLAKICEKQGEFQEAQEYIKEALLKDENAVYYLELGKLNYLDKKYSQAIINLKDANSLDIFKNNQVEIVEYLIKSYLKNEDEYNAQKLISNQQELDKNRIIYKYNLYKLLQLQGNEKKANTQLVQIKKAKLTKPVDFIDLSEVYYEIKGLEQAIKILNNGIKKYPSEIKLYYQKIKLYALSDKQSDVQEVLKQINEIFK